VTITARKVCAQRRRDFAAKRGSGKARGESVLLGADRADDEQAGFAAVLGREPTPELAAMVADWATQCCSKSPN
jgi:hypothetical protein